MLSTNNKLSEVTFKCRQHNQKAESFCRIKYCTERLLCTRCNHPHTDLESIDSLFAFSTILKREYTREDNSQFVSRFLISLGEVFRAVKSTEESLLWLHQMLVSESESSAQLKASVQSLQILSIQLTAFLSQCKDVKQITDSRQLSELIEWYLTLRSAVSSQAVFDERDREYMQALSYEVSKTSLMLCEKVINLTQKFNIMKRGGIISQDRPVNQVERPHAHAQEQTNQRTTNSDSISDNTVPLVKSEEIQTEQKIIMEEEKVPTEEKKIEEQAADTQITKSKRSQRQTREMKNLIPPEPKEKTESAQKKTAKKTKAPKEPEYKPQIEPFALANNKIVETSIPTKLFEGDQKERIEIVEKWLAKYENSQEKTPESEKEAKQIKIDLEAAKELLKTSTVITGAPETNPIKDLKKDITRIFNELLKSPDSKPPEIFLEMIQGRLEEKRLELIDQFKQKAREEEIRGLITKMKESRIDLKHELSKLIEICLEYQLRWGKLQTEIASFQTKTHDFAVYQNSMERFCRLRLMTQNYEQTINQFFEVKSAQVHLEYFSTCLHKFDLSNQLQFAYSKDTNELASEVVFQRLQEVSIHKAREIIAQTTRPTQISCTFGESAEELTQMIEQAETLQKGLVEALKNYENDQNKEAVLLRAEKSLQSKLFFDEMARLKPFSPKIVPKLPAQPVKVKKVNPKAETKADSMESDDESSDEFKLSKRKKKVDHEVVPQLNVATRSTRSRPQVAE